MPLTPTFQPMTWMLTFPILVLMMQAGFTCLETGMVRDKNRINVAILANKLLTRMRLPFS